MGQEQIDTRGETENRDSDSRINTGFLKDFIHGGLLFTAIEVGVFIFAVFSGDINIRTLPNYLIGEIFFSGLALFCLFVAVFSGLSMYRNALRQFHETGDLYLAACKERDLLKIKLEIMRDEKIAAKNSLRIERERCE